MTTPASSTAGTILAHASGVTGAAAPETRIGLASLAHAFCQLVELTARRGDAAPMRAATLEAAEELAFTLTYEVSHSLAMPHEPQLEALDLYWSQAALRQCRELAALEDHTLARIERVLGRALSAWNYRRTGVERRSRPRAEELPAQAAVVRRVLRG